MQVIGTVLPSVYGPIIRFGCTLVPFSFKIVNFLGGTGNAKQRKFMNYIFISVHCVSFNCLPLYETLSLGKIIQFLCCYFILLKMK